VERLGGARLRTALPNGGCREAIDFSSNDYLGLAEHPELIAAARAALEQLGTGAGAARLMSGDLLCNHALEEAVAAWKGTEAALLFGSGFLANLGVIPALLGRGDLILADRLCHASIYDGCRLSGATLRRFRHNDMNQLEDLLIRERPRFRRALLVVESIYSMDGDRAPLRDLASLKKRFDCLLMIDEAHATGIFGANGSGVVEEEGITGDVDLIMGTFGKALGSYGAYIAASGQMVRYLLNSARTFIFSTGLPPATIGASLRAIELLREKSSYRVELLQKATLFKDLLIKAGIDQPLGPSQIVPIVVGQSDRALAIATRLREQGFFVTAVRPPTVAKGTARLRFSITRLHSEEMLMGAAAALLSALPPT